MKSTSIILLAAGPSSRMGQSKQALIINNEALLVHSCKTAIHTSLPVTVVLGANEAAHRRLIEHLNVDIIMNEKWETGMGASLKAGLKYVLYKMNAVDSIIVMVCDQLFLQTEHLLKLKSVFDGTDKLIVASFYSNTAGVPVLFDKRLFPEILNSSDQQGAKMIITKHPDETVCVNFPEGNADLDTMDDVRKYLSR